LFPLAATGTGTFTPAPVAGNAPGGAWVSKKLGFLDFMAAGCARSKVAAPKAQERGFELALPILDV